MIDYLFIKRIFAFLGVKGLLALFLAMLLILVFFQKRELGTFLEQKEKENLNLQLRILHLEGENEKAKNELLKQNEALEKLRLSYDKHLKPMDFSRLERIQSKALTCQDEVKSYKELMRVLWDGG